MQYYNYDGVDGLATRVGHDSRPIVGSISMPNTPLIKKIIVTPNNVHLKTYVAWEVLKIQLTLN